ncbi:hypothetical protein GOP47_0027032 [Adiantum capillus-veneris]|nr:hypothetical protein GOP47_0027032 [Adiantum capillus-veneris]
MQALGSQYRSFWKGRPECVWRMHSEEKALNFEVEGLARTLHRCRKEKDHLQASQVHQYMRERGLDTHELLGNCLVSMLAEVGSMSDAQQVFDKLPNRSSSSLSSLLICYLKNDCPQQTLNAYQQMENNDFECLNEHAFVALLKACSILKDLRTGLRVHAEVASIGLLEKSVFIGSVLINMYAKCGIIAKAQQMFAKSVVRDVVTWTALITGFVEHGNCEEALHCFDVMQLEGVSPNATTYVSSMKACSLSGAIEKGHDIHAEMERIGALSENAFVGSAVVDMYCKFGMVNVAHEVFDRVPTRDVVLWTALIAGYSENGYSEYALDCFEHMQSEGVSPNVATYMCVLKACGGIGAGDKGQTIHAEINRQGLLETNVLVGGALLDMYAKCGLLIKAQDVFDSLQVRDAVSWTALIAGYSDHGHGEEAIACFEKMQKSGINPEAATVVCILKACSSMVDPEKCSKILVEIERHGWLEKDLVVGSTAIDMYAKCGLLDKAQQVFDKLRVRDVVSWTSLISGYAEHGFEAEALKCMEQMQLEGICPNVITYVCSLKGHNGKEVSEEASKLHADIKRHGLEKNLVVANTLISMYAKCGLFSIARKILDELPGRDVISWTALLTGFLQHGRCEEAIKCYEQMQSEGISPNAATYVSLLKAFGTVGAIDKGIEIHNEIERHGLLEQDVVIGNTLVDICAEHGSFRKARELFDKLDVRNVFSWNALIAGYVEHGYEKEALKCFEQMQLEGVIPSATTWVCVLKVCGNTGARVRGKHFHALLEGTGLIERDAWVGSSLVDMYGKCGLPTSAQQVFEKLPVRDVVCWTALMAGYAEHGDFNKASQCLEQMQLEDVPLSPVASALTFKLFGKAGALSKGQDLHNSIENNGLYTDQYVCSSVVDMYVKCGSIAKAQEAFNKIPDRNLVSWTSLLRGYIEHGHEKEAIKCYDQMQREGFFPNDVTLLCCLKACGNIGNVEWGNKLHAEVERRGLLEGTFVGNSLVSMYAKCNSLKAAKKVFDRLPIQDLVSWNALMTGYAECGEIESIFDVFSKMLGSGIQPDSITFVLVLTACTRAGELRKGETLFEAMSKKYGILPTIEHFTCVIDNLGRSGHIDKGLTMIRKLPIRPDPVLWRCVLSACKFWGSVNYGQQGFAHALIS